MVLKLKAWSMNKLAQSSQREQEESMEIVISLTCPREKDKIPYLAYPDFPLEKDHGVHLDLRSL